MVSSLEQTDWLHMLQLQLTVGDVWGVPERENSKRQKRSISYTHTVKKKWAAWVFSNKSYMWGVCGNVFGSILYVTEQFCSKKTGPHMYIIYMGQSFVLGSLQFGHVELLWCESCTVPTWSWHQRASEHFVRDSAAVRTSHICLSACLTSVIRHWKNQFMLTYFPFSFHTIMPH